MSTWWQEIRPAATPQHGRCRWAPPSTHLFRCSAPTVDGLEWIGGRPNDGCASWSRARVWMAVVDQRPPLAIRVLTLSGASGPSLVMAMGVGRELLVGCWLGGRGGPFLSSYVILPASWSPESVRVGLRVPALSQGSLSIGATAFRHRELPLTVSPSWSETRRRVARRLRTRSWS
jgi:hypothetical protein